MSCKITIYRSNQTEALGDGLAKLLQERPLPDLFSAETIIVGSPGLRDWLSRTLLYKLGIAANLEFQFEGILAKWSYEAARRFQARERSSGPSASTPSIFDTRVSPPWVSDQLAWHIAAELRDWGNEGRDDQLASYLKSSQPEDDCDAISLPLYSFSVELATLFNRYHSWRPDMIAAWSRGKDVAATRSGRLVDINDLPAAPTWQPELWRRVQKRLDQVGAVDPISELLIDDWRDDQQVIADSVTAKPQLIEEMRQFLPKRLILFGVTSLSPRQYLILSRISQAIPVHWFTTAPTPLWLGDQTYNQLSEDKKARNRLNEVDRDSARREYITTPLEIAQTDDDLSAPVTDFGELDGLVCPLVASFAKIPRATQILQEQMFPSIREGDTEFIHPLDAAVRPRFDPANAPYISMLQRLQADVYTLEADAYYSEDAAQEEHRLDFSEGEIVRSLRGSRHVDESDNSLAFHSCYGPARQVDTVRDIVVDALNRDPTLHPRDICVMVPDIGTYTPLIETKFREHSPWSDSYKNTGIPPIPIRIQDRSIRQTNPVAAVIIALFGLSTGERTPADLMSLLAMEPVMAKFGFERDELATLEAWLKSAGARREVVASNRTTTSGSDTRLRHTLLMATERIALGAVMGRELIEEPDGNVLAHIERDELPPVFPLDEAGDSGLAKRSLLFLETTLHAISELDEPRSLREWAKIISSEDRSAPGLLQRFVSLDGAKAWQLAQLSDELDTLLQVSRATADTTKISGRAVASWMERQLDQAQPQTNEGVNSLTFCSMLPARSVPYRMIILLGVDADVFPRVGTRPAWDLMALAPRAWDRNPRDEDRHYFLDAILNAQESCHIVFSGKSPQSNEEIAPAVPIARLMEIVDRRFEPIRGRAPSQWLTRTYSLQPFSPANFKQPQPLEALESAPPPASYHRGYFAAAKQLSDSKQGAWELEIPWSQPPALPEPIAGRPEVELGLDELYRFYRSPLESWIKWSTGMRRVWDEEDPGPFFPLERDNLQILKTNQEIASLGVAPRDELIYALPEQPLGRASSEYLKDTALRVRVMRDNLYGAAGPLEEPFDISIRVPFELPDPTDAQRAVRITLSSRLKIARHTATGRLLVVGEDYGFFDEWRALRATLQLAAALAQSDEAPELAQVGGTLTAIASGGPNIAPSYHLIGVGALRAGARREPALSDADDAKAWLTQALSTWLSLSARPTPALSEFGLGSVVKSVDAKTLEWPGELAAALAVDAPAHDSSAWERALQQALASADGAISWEDAMAEARKNAHMPREPSRFGGSTWSSTLMRRVYRNFSPLEHWPEAFNIDSLRLYIPTMLAWHVHDHATAEGLNRLLQPLSDY